MRPRANMELGAREAEGASVHFCREVLIAKGFFQRLVGLAAFKAMPSDAGLLFLGCSSVHCLFMHVPIDVVSLRKYGIGETRICRDMQNPTLNAGDELVAFEVLGTQTVSPWRLARRHAGATAVLELAVGGARDLRYGDILHVRLS